MAKTNKQLNLVLAEDGEDPLVLDCSWSGEVNRDPPDLLKVRAKALLRALCIFLIIAKFLKEKSRKSKRKVAQGLPVLQVAIPKRTWIATLAEARTATIIWIKTHFHIPDNEMFFSGNVGSTHNIGGKECPSVTFIEKNLPLKNVKISLKARTYNSKARPLLAKEMIPYALTLESKHWKNSAVTALFSKKASTEKVASQTKVATFVPSAPLTINNTKIDTRLLIEKECDAFRAACEPLYRSLQNRFIGVSTRENNFTEFLFDNLFWYFSDGSYYFDDLNKKKCQLFRKEKIQPLSDIEISDLTWRATNNLTYAHRKTLYRADWERMVFFGSRHVLKETRRFVDSISRCSKSKNRYLVFGAIISVQLTFCSVTSELLSALLSEIEGSDGDREKFLPLLNAVNEKFLLNVDLLRQYCISESNIPKVLEGLSLVLKPHIAFLNALNDGLREMEKKSLTDE